MIIVISSTSNHWRALRWISGDGVIAKGEPGPRRRARREAGTLARGFNGSFRYSSELPLLSHGEKTRTKVVPKTRITTAKRIEVVLKYYWHGVKCVVEGAFRLLQVNCPLWWFSLIVSDPVITYVEGVVFDELARPVYLRVAQRACNEPYLAEEVPKSIREAKNCDAGRFQDHAGPTGLHSVAERPAGERGGPAQLGRAGAARDGARGVRGGAGWQGTAGAPVGQAHIWGLRRTGGTPRPNRGGAQVALLRTRCWQWAMPKPGYCRTYICILPKVIIAERKNDLIVNHCFVAEWPKRFEKYLFICRDVPSMFSQILYVKPKCQMTTISPLEKYINEWLLINIYKNHWLLWLGK